VKRLFISLRNPVGHLKNVKIDLERKKEIAIAEVNLSFLIFENPFFFVKRIESMSTASLNFPKKGIKNKTRKDNRTPLPILHSLLQIYHHYYYYDINHFQMFGFLFCKHLKHVYIV